jgi:murein DD-endopeptidase MepM/ murein hydrolase activator NlpD
MGKEQAKVNTNEEPTAAENVIMQCIVCGILIVAVLLISMMDSAPTAALRYGLRQVLSGAETVSELITEVRYHGGEFIGWGPTETEPPSFPQEIFPQETLPQLETFSPAYPEIFYQPEYFFRPESSSFELQSFSPVSPAWLSPAVGRVSSPSGIRNNPVTGRREFHDGIDIAVPTGTPILAPKAGTVIASGFCRGYGNFMRLAHENGYITFFAHLSRAAYAVGDSVYQGRRIAYSGNTGQSTGPHLHFGIFNSGQFVDPLTRVTP